MWRLKLFLKALAGRIGWLRRLFQRMGYYRLGEMNCKGYALRTFQRHWNSSWLAYPAGGTCLEIGPGLALSTAIVSRAIGFDSTLLLDCDAFAQTSTTIYWELRDYFAQAGVELPPLAEGDAVEDILRRYAATYWTGGDEELAKLATESVGFSFSHAVLSQIPRQRVLSFLHQLRRVSQPNTRSSHWIDLTDYFGGGFHQLRFSEALWESRPIRESGIYTNRLRFSQWLNLFEEAGIAYRISEQRMASRFPLHLSALNEQFRGLSEEDLLTQSFRVEFLWGQSR